MYNFKALEYCANMNEIIHLENSAKYAEEG